MDTQNVNQIQNIRNGILPENFLKLLERYSQQGKEIPDLVKITNDVISIKSQIKEYFNTDMPITHIDMVLKALSAMGISKIQGLLSNYRMYNSFIGFVIDNLAE